MARHRPDRPAPEPDFDKLLHWLLLHRGTGLLLEPDQAPLFRVGGALCPMELAPLSQEELGALLRLVLTSRQRRALQELGAVEFDYALKRPRQQFRVGVVGQGAQLRVSVYLLLS